MSLTTHTEQRTVLTAHPGPFAKPGGGPVAGFEGGEVQPGQEGGLGEVDSYVRQLGGDSVDEPSPVAVEQGYQGIGPLVGLFPGDGRRFATKPVDAPEQLLRNAEEPAVEVLVGERCHGGPKATDGKGLDA